MDVAVGFDVLVLIFSLPQQGHEFTLKLLLALFDLLPAEKIVGFRYHTKDFK